MMGWWHAGESGGIAGLQNADAEDEGPLVGDGPADVLGDALQEVIQCYRRGLGRSPTVEELDLCWKFVTGPYRH